MRHKCVRCGWWTDRESLAREVKGMSVLYCCIDSLECKRHLAFRNGRKDTRLYKTWKAALVDKKKRSWRLHT